MEVLNGFIVIPFMIAIAKWAWMLFERCFFKKERELANQWHSVLREGRDPIKERNK